jgi:hypothetical protein
MKKTSLLITFLMVTIPFFAWTQSLELLYPDGSALTSETIIAEGINDTTEINIQLFVRNKTTEQKDVYVKVYQKNVVENSYCQYCWDACYNIATSQSQSHLSIAANDTAKIFYSLYKPLGNTGTTHLMYTFFVNKNESDSVSVNIMYNVTVNSSNQLLLNTSYIYTYPNPANEYLDFNLNNTNSKSSIKIYNITGKLVKTATIQNENKLRLNVVDLKPGIYLWTVESKGIILATNKFIKR